MKIVKNIDFYIDGERSDYFQIIAGAGLFVAYQVDTDNEAHYQIFYDRMQTVKDDELLSNHRKDKYITSRIEFARELLAK